MIEFLSVVLVTLVGWVLLIFVMSYFSVDPEKGETPLDRLDRGTTKFRKMTEEMAEKAKAEKEKSRERDRQDQLEQWLVSLALDHRMRHDPNYRRLLDERERGKTTLELVMDRERRTQDPEYRQLLHEGRKLFEDAQRPREVNRRRERIQAFFKEDSEPKNPGFSHDGKSESKLIVPTPFSSSKSSAQEPQGTCLPIGITDPSSAGSNLLLKMQLLKKQREEVWECVRSMGIYQLVHFTRCENLSSILQHGICSISQCKNEGISAVRNDQLRLDNHFDRVSLSISFPNYRMFYKYRQLNPQSEWAVLLVSPKVMRNQSCYFYEHNAADHRMRHKQLRLQDGPNELCKMFETNGMQRPIWLQTYDPTDPQAEVMVRGVINPSLIETIAFETNEIAEKWRQHTGGIDVICAGKDEGLFSNRKHVRNGQLKR